MGVIVLSVQYAVDKALRYCLFMLNAHALRCPRRGAFQGTQPIEGSKTHHKKASTRVNNRGHAGLEQKEASRLFNS